MSKTSHVFAALAALLAAAEARNLHQPEATVAVDYAVNGITPKPTFAPVLPELFRRADSNTQTALVAPDNTCGFISGLAGAGYTCGIGASCVFFTSSTAPGRVACCNTVACNARATCIDYNEFYTQSKCNNGCLVDTFTLKCTQTALPYCNTISFPGGIVDVFCNRVNISVVQTAQTTYTGQSSRTFTPIALTGNALGGTTSSVSQPSGSNSGSSSHTTSAAGDGGGGGDSDGSSNGDNSNNNNNNNGGGSSTPVGAIVGGVVGGIGGLALIGAAVFFFLRKKKNSVPEPSPPTDVIPPAYQAPMQQNQSGFYDPKFAVAASQQPYPPHNQQYPQPSVYSTSPPMSPNSQPPMSAGYMDPRMSMAPSNISPTPSSGFGTPGVTGTPAFQPQQGVIHEAPGNAADHHRGHMHELA